MPDPNAPRRAGRPGYDAWYLTFADPEQGIGVWLRWTSFFPHAGVDAQPHSALWAFVLHRGRPDLHAGVRQVLPYQPAMRDLRRGEIASPRGRARWQLSWRSLAPPFAFAGGLLERLAPTGNAAAHPRLLVTGAVELNGRHHTFENAPGGQGHTWGSRHAATWNWVHACLSDGWVTGATTPLGSPFGADLAGHLRRRTGFAALRARRPTSVTRWSAGDIEVSARLDDCVAVEYADPAGGRRVCYHSEFATITVAGQVVTTTAAFEFAAPEPLPERPPIEL